MSLQTSFNKERAVYLAPAIRMLTGGVIVKFVCNTELTESEKSISQFDKTALFISSCEDIEEQYTVLETKINEYKEKFGYSPKMVAVQDLGIYCCGATKAQADNISNAVCGKAFSPEKEIAGYKRIAEKILIVTGSAQGFGQGIAEEMLKEGGNVVIADLNYELASSLCD